MDVPIKRQDAHSRQEIRAHHVFNNVHNPSCQRLLVVLFSNEMEKLKNIFMRFESVKSQYEIALSLLENFLISIIFAFLIASLCF